MQKILSVRTVRTVGTYVLVSVLAVGMLVSYMPTTAYALDTGYKSPTSNASNDAGSGDDWTNPTNAHANGGGFASEENDERHRYFNFGLGVPSGAVIQGIEVKVDAWSSDNNGCRLGVDLSWNGGSSWVSQKQQNLTGSETTYTLGSGSDTWGRSWTSSELSDANFRVRVHDIDPGGSCSGDPRLDWIQTRVTYTEPVIPAPNPALGASCGLDIALALDTSGSIDDAELGQMKSAFVGFVNALLPSTPTQFSLIRYDDDAATVQAFTDNSATIIAAINGTNGDGSTNWEAGLEEANSTFDPRADKADVIIFASDGNPTESDGPLSDLEDAITAANIIKGEGTRIITIGIGNDLNLGNLEDISSPDAVYSGSFATLEATLQQVAIDLCGGTITVKKLIDADGNLATTNDRTNGAGWTINANVLPGDGDSATPTSGVTAGDGTFNFAIELGPNDSASASVSEVVQAGYSALSASCTSGQNPIGTPGTDSVTGLTLGPNDIVTCTFINTQVGKIVVDKVTNPSGDLQVFSFDASGGNYQDFILADLDAPNEQTLPVGTYSVTEGAQGGWDLSSATCVSSLGHNETVGNISLQGGEVVTCTFTNTKKGKLIVDKVTNPSGDSQTFNISASGTGTISGNVNGSITDASGWEYTVTPGTYSVTETVPAGWTQSSNTCTDVVVGAGEEKTCTITNTKLGSITVLKATAGGDADFSFTGDASGTISNGETIVVTDLVPGTYTSTEGALAGWDLTGLTCNDNNSTGDINTGVATFNLEAGENITCTFTNTKLPTLTVTKSVVNDNGGTLAVANFPLFIDGNSVTSGVANIVALGAHTVTETSQTGYTASAWGGDCAVDGTITLAAGENKTCTITNDDNAPSLTLVKVVENDNNGGATESAWTLTATGPTGFSGAGPQVANGASFDAGTYDLSEAGPSGYTASDWVCVGGNQTDGDTISLALGESATCTITNNDVQPLLTVTKVVINHGGNAQISDFPLFVNATPVTSGTQTGFNAGSYTVSETVSEDYTATITGDCALDGSITLAAGDVKSCTITNEEKPAKVIVKKTVVNNGGSASASSFGPYLVGTTEVVLDAETTLNSGTYQVDETESEDYTVSFGGNCTSTGLITLTPGETVTCEITNTEKPAKLIVNKIVINDNGGTLQEANVPLFVDGNPVGDNVENTFTSGAHIVSETAQTGYTATIGGDCDANGNVVLTPGETKTCTITNNDQPGTLIVKKTVVNDNGGTLEADDFTFSVNAQTAVAFEADGQNDLTVNAGTYTVTEPEVFGYATSYANCTDVVVSNGETETCVITNNDIAPKLTVIKNVVNDNGGTAVAGDFSMIVNSNGAVPAGQFPGSAGGTVVTLVAGEPYGVAESVVSGYAPTYGENCAGTLSVGQEVTCTVTNDDIAPTLTVIKTVVNDNGGNAVVADFPLFINGNSVVSGATTTLASNVLYTVTETNQTGYTASVWGGDCSANGTITLSPGDQKVCTITNDDVAPTITVIKSVTNDNGGNAVVSDFPLFVSGSPVLSGAENAFEANTLYTVSETNLAGYTAGAWGGDCAADGSITLSEGQKAVCTITNNDIAPTITLNKVVDNNNGGSAGVNDFGLTIGGTPVTSGQILPVNANQAYALNEVGLSGYVFDGITGDAKCPQVLGGTVTLDEGENVSCTIANNDQQSFIIVDKTVINDNGGDAKPDDFNLTVDEEEVLDGVAFPVNPGDYTVGEDNLFGYTAGAWGGHCAIDGTVTVALGETKTCTITNDDVAPKLTLVKEVVINNGGTAVGTDWTLSANGATPISGAGGATSDASFVAGMYELSESGGPSGYTASDWVCTGTGNQASDDSIELDVGEEATCTITNDDQQGKLIVRKVLTNNDGGNNPETSFSFKVNGGDSQFFEGDLANAIDVNAGVYTVVEDAVDGYVATYDNCSQVVVSNGETETCIITNDDVAPTITLIKNVLNNNGGKAEADDFGLTIGGASVNSGQTLAVDANTEIALNEAGLVGYSFVEITGDEKCPAVLGGMVVLNEGEDITCTITNDDEQGTLIVEKVLVQDNGGVETADDFSFQIDGGTAIPFEVDGNNAIALDAGTYDVTEVDFYGYTTSYEGCSQVVITNGGEATCTITNDDIAPRLKLVKKVVGGPLNANVWNLKATGPTTISGNGGVDSQNALPGTFKAGTYTLTETSANPGAVHYTTSGAWSCIGTGNEITLGLADEVECTIVNTYVPPGTIIVEKQTVPDGSEKVFDFDSTFTDPYTLSDGQSTTTAGLVPGVYSVAEAPEELWDSEAVCSDGSPADAIDLQSGETVTCVFTNTRHTGTIELKKEWVGTPGSAHLWIGTTVGTNDVADQHADGVDTTTGTIQVETGTYYISEAGNDLANYTPTLSCVDEDGAVDVGISGALEVEKNKNVICTYTNTREQGTLTVIKDVVNDNGGALLEDDFSFRINGGDPIFFEEDGENVFALDTGTYSVVEEAATGYTTSYGNSLNQNLDCTDLAIEEDGNVTCTITNNDQAGTLIVKKAIVGNEQASPTAFSFSVNGQQAVPFESDGQNDLTVSAGTYTVVETEDSNYSTSYQNCTDVVVSLGEVETCLITNTYIPDGTITITKVIVGGDATKDSFAPYTIDAVEVEEGVAVPVEPGTHTVAETNPVDSNYTAVIGGDCNAEGVVEVLSGEAYECTITNTYVPPTADLIVKKVIIGETENGPDQFSFTINGGDPIFFEEDGENEFLGITPGSYDILEVEMEGYDVSYDNCDIELLGGEEEICTITNTPKVDLCPNLEGYQNEVPEGLEIDEAGNCVPVVIACELREELLVNGGFETPVVTNGALWDIFPSGTSGLGWVAEWLDPSGAPEIANVEIQENGLSGWTASEGSQWSELDSDWGGPSSGQSGEAGAVALTQTIPTEVGAEYTVSFDFSARPSTAASQNSVEVLVDGSVVYTVPETAPAGTTAWTAHEVTFVATDSSAEITLRYAGTANDSLGAFVDNASAYCSGLPEVECEEGYHFDEETQQCVPDDNGGDDCEEGYHFDEETQQCVPDEDQCTPEQVIRMYESNAGTTVDGSSSVVLSFIHEAWTAFIDGASWIWSEEPIADAVNDTTETFEKSFIVEGTPVGATLEIAADNSYEVLINGNPMVPECKDETEYNYRADGQDTCEIAAEQLEIGENTLTFIVKNWAQENGTPTSNPAGLLYKLTVESNTICDPENPCEEGEVFDEELNQCVPTEVTQCSDGIDNSDEEDGLSDEEDPGCWSNPEDPESYNPNDDDETDGEVESFSDVCPNIDGIQEEIPEGYVWEEDDQECDKTSSGGGGGGTRNRSSSNGGSVLGAATGVLPEGCTPLLNDYLHKDWNNNPEEVGKLQMFLNKFMSAGLAENGVFDAATFEWVKAFQMAYGEIVLNPWIGFPGSGIFGNNTPTGFVYITTKWHINNLWCEDLKAPMPTLI